MTYNKTCIEPGLPHLTETKSGNTTVFSTIWSLVVQIRSVSEISRMDKTYGKKEYMKRITETFY